MGKSRGKPFLLPRSMILISLLCVLFQTVSGQIFAVVYVDSDSTEGVAQSPREEVPNKLRASEATTESQVQRIRKHKKYDPNEEKLKKLEGVKPLEKSFAFQEYKARKLAKEARKASTERPLAQDHFQGRSNVDSPPPGTNVLFRQKNRRIQLRRIRRQAVGDEDGDDAPPPASDHPKPTPNPNVTHNQQFAITNTETGQSQSQASGASDTDEMNFNPDGSVKTHKLGSSNLNKQESLQFSKSESRIPVASALDVDSILGKDATGAQKSLLSHSKLTSLGQMAPMQPMAPARVGRSRRKNKGSAGGETKANR